MRPGYPAGPFTTTVSVNGPVVGMNVTPTVRSATIVTVHWPATTAPHPVHARLRSRPPVLP